MLVNTLAGANSLRCIAIYCLVENIRYLIQALACKQLRKTVVNLTKVLEYSLAFFLGIGNIVSLADSLNAILYHSAILRLANTFAHCFCNVLRCEEVVNIKQCVVQGTLLILQLLTQRLNLLQRLLGCRLARFACWSLNRLRYLNALCYAQVVLQEDLVLSCNIFGLRQ